MDDFLPHDLSHARRAAAFVSVSAAVALLVITVAQRDSTPFVAANLLTVAVFAVLGVLVLRVREGVAAVACLALPLVGVVWLAGLDVVTADATVAGQIFFVLPVLFAATQLRRRGGYLVLLAAVAGEGVVCWSVLPPAVAITDFVHVSAVMSLIAVLLVQAGVRQRRLVEALQEQAAIDPLTGLVTRRVLDDALGASLASAGGRSGTSLLLVDIDHFKRVNDTHGHPVGDDALALVGTVLTASSRPSDVIARMGGDELALLLTSCPYESALERAERIVEQVRALSLPVDDDQGVRLTVSVGVAHAPEHATDVRELYTAADEALYAAKREGRDRVRGARPLAERGPVPRQTGDDASRSAVIRAAAPRGA